MKNLVEALKECEAIKFGDFTLASGKKSRYYVDIKKVVFGTNYPDTEALKFFDKDGVIVEQLALKTEPEP